MEPALKRLKLTQSTDLAEQSSELDSSNNTMDKTITQVTVPKPGDAQLTLLGLPIDVRLLIFDFIFGDACITMTRSGWIGELTFIRSPSLRAAASILLVNKQIRSEALIFFERMKISLVISSVKSMYGAQYRIATIPAKLQAQITAINLATPDSRFNEWLKTPGVNLSKLKHVSICHHLYHFEENERPFGSNTEIEKRVSDDVRDEYNGWTGIWSHWHPNNSVHQINATFVVWYLNTRRSLTHGWEVQMDSTTTTVISVVPKVFRKRKFDRSSLRSGLSGDEIRAAGLAWTYSPDGWSSSEGWWANEFGNGISEQEQAEHLEGYKALKW